jgi:transposase InsO family protein
LSSKKADEIAGHLWQIWTQFGPPIVLHTDNGREFENAVVRALCEEFDVKIVHGIPRKSSTQGSVERANQCVENIILTYQSQNGCSNWAENLLLFQMMKNNRF